VKKVLLFEALAVLLLAGVMALLLYRKAPADVPLSSVEEAILSKHELSGMEKAGDMRMKRAFGLNSADYEEVLYFAPDNTMSVSELLILKCRDESALAGVTEAFQSRLDVQKKNFDGYGTDQTELLLHARIGSAGPYAWFIVGREADQLLETVQSVWEVKK